MQTDSAWARIGLILGVMGMATAAVAQDSHCDDSGRGSATTPMSDFTDNGDGTVTHRESGLQWARCSVGQEFNGSGCDGQAQVFFWNETDDAVAQINAQGGIGGYSDWRVPTLDELLTIVERCRQAPAINPDLFPNTPWTGYWSATLHRDSNDPHEVEHVSNPAYRGAHDEEEEEDEEGNRREKNPEAWFVGFYKGLEYPYDIYSSYRLRPVRSAN